MISLKRTMDTEGLQQQLEKQKQLHYEALSAYTAAIEGIREHALRACPPAAENLAQPLLQLLQSVSAQPADSDLIQSKGELLLCLATFGDRGAQEYTDMAVDIREMVRLAVSATDSLALKSSRDSKEISRFATEVESIAAVENVTELRGLLRLEVHHLHECLEKMARDDAEMIQRLHGDLRTLRQKLSRAEEMSCVDPLTKLANRRGLGHHINLRIQSGATFCLLVFDVERMRYINERHGEAFGDATLCEFGNRLASSIRGTDLACRYSGDTFVVVLDCKLPDAMPRSRQIHTKACGRFDLVAAESNLRLEIDASLGVAEYRAGETLPQMLARTDPRLAEKAKS